VAYTGASKRILEHKCKGDEATLVKNLCTGNYETAAHAALNLESLRSHIAEGFTRELKKEMKEYMSKKDSLSAAMGILKSCPSIQQQHFWKKPKKQCPFFTQ